MPEVTEVSSPLPDRQRIDKWLWHARVTKTRTAAQKLVVSGKIRVNRDKIADASRPVRAGDVLTLPSDAGVRILRIAAIGSRRGPSSEARLLYEDLSPPAAPRPTPRERVGGRPTKRDRRAIDALEGHAAGLEDDISTDTE